ncbi:MAG: hypothetical protein HFI86_02035 [Bacilli bacterium]|nr:hypothetical protein [Bacilli bacterium]
MKEILKSKGILAFFIFLIAIGFISSISINNQKNVSAENTNNKIISQK